MDAGLTDETAVAQMTATYYEVQNSVIDLEEQINQVENSLSLFYPSITFLSFHNTERQCRLDQLHRRPHHQSCQVCHIGTGFAHTAVIQPWYPDCPPPNSQSAAGRGITGLQTTVAQCRYRSKRCINLLSDQQTET